MRIVRWFFVLLVLAALAFGVAYYLAGSAAGPAITINQPTVIGRAGTLDVTIDAPAAELTALNVQLEQKGRVGWRFDEKKWRSHPHHAPDWKNDASRA
jgi:hypothetical protein